MSKTTKTVLLVLGGIAALGCLCSGGCLALGLAGSNAATSEDTGAATAGDAPAPTIPLSGTRTTWGGYSVVVPPGMTSAVGPDGLQLQQGGLANGACTIVLLPQEPASGAPDAQAFAIVTRYFQGKATGFLGEYTGRDVYSGQERGTSARGFDWVELPELWPLGANGGQLDARVRILLVQLGAKVAPIVGLETGGAKCLTTKDWAWLRVFHTLEFPEAGLKAGASAPVVGTWSLASSSAASSTEYRSDGTYLAAGGMRTTVAISDTRERQTDRTWAGDGTWSAHGERLTVTPKGQPSKTEWFRVVRMQNQSAPEGWLVELRTFGLSVDGTPYEGGLRRAK
jgi:hypothetical protein